MNASDAARLKEHVADLEQQLLISKALLRRAEAQSASAQPPSGGRPNGPSSLQTPNLFGTPVSLPIGPSLHNLLLLSDSALPLGSFAYSSGLESYLAHHKQRQQQQQQQQQIPHGKPTATPQSLFPTFLRLSIQSLAFTTIPYVLSAFRDPCGLADLDNDLDASTPCTVQRRASIAQGRALLSVYEKAMTKSLHSGSGGGGGGHQPPTTPGGGAAATHLLDRPRRRSSTTLSYFPEGDDDSLEVTTVLDLFSQDLKAAAAAATTNTTGRGDALPEVNGHLAPVWGAVCLSLGLNLEEAGYLFLLNHAKAVISAAVRASVMGPYMAQAYLAGRELQELIRGCLERVWLVKPEDAGQVVPVMDLWVGRHEMLYSRIFNS